jgi:hypothetical protein
MNRYFDQLRFLWEQPTAPPEEMPRGRHEEPAGIPRPLQRATRFALIGFVATGLMGQIIQVRLVAPVDAAPSYTATCIQQNCVGLTNGARAACVRNCQAGQ